ncbi:hypothetical protein BG003_001088 [Podila horticola]|nr:hypothetical protein BG003_001088 [Podila horticola]
MTDKLVTLFCIEDGDSTPFSVDIDPLKTVDHLKVAIKDKKTPRFDDIAADELTLWRVSIPLGPLKDRKQIILGKVESATELDPADDISDFFKETPAKRMIHIIVQRPPQAFNHLKGDLQAGDSIIIPIMGQELKDFGLHGQGRQLFITEQMLDLWEDMRGDKDRTYRRVLSGPMGVGKSYLSYFLAARAYAEGWLVLYISNAGLLKMTSEDQSTLEVVKRFLALNKDILTGAELEMLVNDYDGKDDFSTKAVYIIFRYLLMSRDRKTLLLVDEHGKLFEKVPYVPDKFESLNHLSSYSMWGEEAKGSRVIFTGTAHAKYEMEILDESYQPRSVVFVGPLSTNVFSKLLDTYPRLRALAIRGEVIEITNCVPRELVYLSAEVEQVSDPVSLGDLQQWVNSRTNDFYSTAETYYESRSLLRKERFYRALLQTFLGSTSTVDFEWDFMDLGLIYRSKDVGKIGTQHHILCRPAQNALLELFKELPLPEDTKKRIFDGSVSGDDFEEALWQQLILYPQTDCAQSNGSQQQESDNHFT